jgi:hypothetical protein
LARSAAAAALSCLLLLGSAPPSQADISTVTPQEATEMARPLKQQKVNKGRIWGLFILGATALFGSTGEHWVAPAGQGGSGVGQPPPLVELYLNFCYSCFWP